MSFFTVLLIALILIALALCAFAPFILSGRISGQETVALESVMIVTSIIAHGGECSERPLVSGACEGCPFIEDDCNISPEANITRAKRWLEDHGLGIHA